MPRVRRTIYLFIYFQNGPTLDVELLLRGAAKLTSKKQIFAISILTGKEHLITDEELAALSLIPSDRWTSVNQVIRDGRVQRETIDCLAGKGLLLSDKVDDHLRELRRRDEKLSSSKWNIYAALYHFLTKWRDVDVGMNWMVNSSYPEAVRAGRERSLKDYVAEYGSPPHHFHTVANAKEICDLPTVNSGQGLYEILLTRKTTRRFETTRPMKLEELSALLYYVFGCQGYLQFEKGVVGLKKTSPSGGDLHPIEAYPLVLNVSGLKCGLYHYNVRDHSLELMRALQKKQGKALADEFTAGQWYPRSAHALFILSARFYRNFWKYQRHTKAYSVLLMDAAHLSQTFYLVCGEMGLGAFFTAAINAANIEEKLGLDAFEEGAIGICGCGKPARRRSAMDPEFRPYVPRTTVL